jgi:hypothetical protein
VGPVGGNHELKATARDRVWAMTKRRLSREGVWDGSWMRTVALNASEPLSKLSEPGLVCAATRRPISDRGRGVLRAEAAGHCFTLPQEISSSPRDGRLEEGNDDQPMLGEKSDHPIVAWKPGNAGGAKGVTS